MTAESKSSHAIAYFVHWKAFMATATNEQELHEIINQLIEHGISMSEITVEPQLREPRSAR